MKRLLLISAVLFAVLMTACNKNQKAIQKLEGDWEEVSVDGVAVPENEKGVMHFEYCELKKDEWCTAYYIDSDGVNTGAFDYNVQDKGKVMVQRVQDSTKGSIEIQGNIKELNKTTLILELTFFGLGTTTEYKKK